MWDVSHKFLACPEETQALLESKSTGVLKEGNVYAEKSIIGKLDKYRDTVICKTAATVLFFKNSALDMVNK